MYTKTLSGLSGVENGGIDDKKFKRVIILFMGEYIDVDELFEAIKNNNVNLEEIKTINLLAEYGLIFVTFNNGILTYYYNNLKRGKIINFVDVLDVFVVGLGEENDLNFLSLINHEYLRISIKKEMKQKFQKNTKIFVPADGGHISGVFYINSNFDIMLNIKRTYVETGFISVEEKIMNNYLQRAGVNVSEVIRINNELRKIIIER